MAGIRETAMGIGKEDKIPKKTQSSFEDYGIYGGKGYSSENFHDDDEEYIPYKSKKKTSKGEIVIKMVITDNEIGPVAEETYNYDFKKVEMKAKEIAYDRIIKLTGKDIEKKYCMSMSADFNDQADLEITTFLIPNITI
jgi:hypothetical protein